MNKQTTTKTKLKNREIFQKSAKFKNKGTKKSWASFHKPALKIPSPYIRLNLAANTKNLEIGTAAGSVLKSVSGSKIFFTN